MRKREYSYRTTMIEMPLMIVREKAERCRTPEDTRRMCADLENMAVESFHVLLLDSKNGVIDRLMVSMGLLNAALVHPREVFRPAIAANAAAVVVVHNHPSGDPSASEEDIRITKQLIEAGRIVGIAVIDHVIIGRISETCPRGFFSCRESGLCNF